MLTEHLLYIGLCQSIFAAFVLATKKDVTVSDIILVLCLLSVALRFSTRIYIGEVSANDHSDFSVGIIPLTFGPFLYLYTKYLTADNPPFSKMDLLHFLPFTVFLILSLTIFKGRQLILSEDTFFVRDNMLWVRIVFGLACFTSVLLYTIYTYRQLFKYRKLISQSDRNIEQGKKLFWLNFVSLLFMLLFSSYFIMGLINALTFSVNINLLMISSIGLIVLVYSVSYFGIKQPSIWGKFYLKQFNSGIAENGVDINSVEEVVMFNGHNMENMAAGLAEFMEKEKPYLKADLTLVELAEKLNIQKTQLTYLLNAHMGVNFFTYINDYRLQKVMEELIDPKKAHFKILAIAYDCGFNSKSTFNNLFKKFTGTTPSEYRQKHLETTSE